MKLVILLIVVQISALSAFAKGGADDGERYQNQDQYRGKLKTMSRAQVTSDLMRTAFSYVKTCAPRGLKIVGKGIADGLPVVNGLYNATQYPGWKYGYSGDSRVDIWLEARESQLGQEAAFASGVLSWIFGGVITGAIETVPAALIVSAVAVTPKQQEPYKPRGDLYTTGEVVNDASEAWINAQKMNFINALAQSRDAKKECAPFEHQIFDQVAQLYRGKMAAQSNVVASAAAPKKSSVTYTTDMDLYDRNAPVTASPL